MNKVYEGRLFSARFAGYVCVVLLHDEGAWTHCERREARRVISADHSISAFDAGQCRAKFDRCGPHGHGSGSSERTVRCEVLPRAGPIPFTPGAFDDRTLVARPAPCFLRDG